jgi:ATP-dependent DNA helicase RecG
VGLDGRGSGLLPEYRIEGLSEERARAIMRAALRSIEGVLEDPLPVDLLEAHRLLHLEEALRDAHFPSNTTGRGQVRLAFEELLLLQLGVAWRAGKGRGERGPGHKALHELVGDLAWQHSVSLDDSQELAFSDVRRDLRRTRPMARLLQGDVGTGKGLVAQMAALVVAANGAQVAMVFPDALAAERRFLHVEAQLRSIGVAAVCVGDGPDRAQADALRRGEARIVYGTRALLAPDLEWRLAEDPRSAPRSARRHPGADPEQPRVHGVWRL